MSRTIFFTLLGALTLAPPAFCQDDAEGSKDYPAITRMPGYYIGEYHDVQFDSFNFKVAKDKDTGDTKEQTIEGRMIKINYYLKEGVQETSALQVVRNFQNAARAAGAQILLDDRGDNWHDTTWRMKRDGKEVWVLLEARSDAHVLTIVERQAMKQEVAIDAQGMAGSLTSDGAVALYGVYFDTGKSDLKPESDPTLAEIAKLLKENATLKVFVVGHTDMVGDPAANIKLSQARAQAVVAALTGKYGVAAARLTAFGNGPYSPVASNKTEEGRAKNRRVELVEASTR